MAATAIEQKQSSCTHWQCSQVAFFSRKSHLIGSQQGHVYSGFALASHQRLPQGRMTLATGGRFMYISSKRRNNLIGNRAGRIV
jgi:hypothetical protein